MFKTKPWTLDEKKVNTSIVSKPLSLLEKKDKAVSTARVIALFQENPDKEFTNKKLAKELELSEGTVSCITNRLEATSAIKITGVNQRFTAYSLRYQHKDGPLQSAPRYRGIDGKKKDSVQLVHELFEANKDTIYTKKQLIEIFKGQASAGHIGESVRMLLIMQVIKVIDDFEGRVPKFQHIDGNANGLPVYYNEDENYTSLNKFFRNRFFSEKEKKLFREFFKGTCRLYYSSKSLIPTFKKADLENYARQLEKKGLIKGGLLNNG